MGADFQNHGFAMLWTCILKRSHNEKPLKFRIPQILISVINGSSSRDVPITEHSSVVVGTPASYSGDLVFDSRTRGRLPRQIFMCFSQYLQITRYLNEWLKLLMPWSYLETSGCMKPQTKRRISTNQSLKTRSAFNDRTAR